MREIIIIYSSANSIRLILREGEEDRTTHHNDELAFFYCHKSIAY